MRYFNIDWGFRLGQCWFRASSWQKRSEELFDAAAKVTGAPGIGPRIKEEVKLKETDKDEEKADQLLE